MTITDDIAKTTSIARIYVNIIDPVNPDLYMSSYSWRKVGLNEPYQGRVLSISPITFSALGGELQIPTCSVVLDDSDGSVSAFGIDMSRQINIGVYFEGTNYYRVFNAVLDRPAKFADGKCYLDLISYAYPYLGDIDLPTFTADDGMGELTGMTLPAYFGPWEDPNVGAVQCYKIAPFDYRWYFAVTSGADTDFAYTMDNIEVFIKADKVNYSIPVYGSYGSVVSHTTGEMSVDWQLVRGAGTIGSTTITRASSAPTTWKAWYIELTGTLLINGVTAMVGVVSDMRINLQPPTISGVSTVTPAFVVERLAKYWSTKYASFSSGYEDTSWLAAHATAQISGVESKYKITEPCRMVDIIPAILKDSGIYPYFWCTQVTVSSYSSNQLKAFCFSSTSAVTTNYSTTPSRTDYQHMLSFEIVPTSPVTRAYVNTGGVLTSHINSTDESAERAYSGHNVRNENLTLTGITSAISHSLGLHGTSTKNRIFKIVFPWLALEDEPGDIIRLTEHFTGLSSAPALILQKTIDLENMLIEEIVQDLTGLSNSSAYVMLDELDDTAGIQRNVTVPLVPDGANIWVTAASNVIQMRNATNPLSVYNAVVGDIFEMFTATNQLSSAITKVATWDAGNSWWYFEIAGTATATETNVDDADWNCCASWTTASAAQKASSGFVCDTDGEFSNNDAGRVMVI